MKKGGLIKKEKVEKVRIDVRESKRARYKWSYKGGKGNVEKRKREER